MTRPEAENRVSALSPRLFDGLKEAEIRSIMSAAELRFVKRGDILIRQGGPSKYLGLVVTGRARFFFNTPDGEKLILIWLPPGEPFGGAALLTEPSDYRFSVEAVQDGCVLAWERPAIRRLALRMPRLFENGLAIASTYLDWYIATHVGLACHDAPQRLAHVLASLATAIGRQTEHGVELDVTNEELAATANITVFTTSRLLARWQKLRLIKKARGHILLQSPERFWREPL